jgi:hypothetical protein
VIFGLPACIIGELFFNKIALQNHPAKPPLKITLRSAFSLTGPDPMKLFKTACLLVPLLCAAAAMSAGAALAQADLMPPAGSAAAIAVAPAPGAAPPSGALQPPAGLNNGTIQNTDQNTDQNTGPLPGEAAGVDYPSLTLTPDKSVILTLDKPARSVIVGNPAHLAAIMDSTKRLVLIPRQPGATYFIVLGDNGEVIMQRHILVDAPQERYVRIRKSCALAGSNNNCQPTQVYYCPGMCHEINVQTSGGGGVSAGSVTIDSAGGGQDSAPPAEEPPAEEAPAEESTGTTGDDQ